MEKVFKFATANVGEMKTEKLTEWFCGVEIPENQTFTIWILSLATGERSLWHGGGLSCRMEASREMTKEGEIARRTE